MNLLLLVSLTDVVDFVNNHESFNSDIKIIFSGDFNDVINYVNDVNCIASLSPIVYFPTREHRTIDQFL